MRSLTVLIAGAMLSVSALAYALPEADFCAVSTTGSSSGTVESVREVPLVRDLHAFDADVLEHRVAPETAEQLVVRLDVGPLVVFTQKQSHRLNPGQRVRVTLSESIARVALESDECATPLASGAQRLF